MIPVPIAPSHPASGERPRICWITTTPFIANAFLSPHLESLAAHFEVTLVLNLDDRYPLRPLSGGIRVLGIPLNRRATPFADLRACAVLFKLLRRERFRAVHTFAPKAGLLGMLAALLARVPVRVHTFQGEVWAARRGWKRLVLKSADRLTAWLATHRLIVGRGERNFLEAKGILSGNRSEVLADGSIAGVDMERFHPDPAARSKIRHELQFLQSELMILFLGRLVRDKGVLDLAEAFARIANRAPNAVLVFVGPDEDNVSAEITLRAGSERERVRFVGYTDEPETYLAAADVLSLPSYREGFSTVILEAAACEVPAVASRIYGTEDTLIDGVTGRLCDPGNVEQLAGVLAGLLEDESLRRAMGIAARERVAREFSRERLTRAMVDFYRNVMDA